MDIFNPYEILVNTDILLKCLDKTYKIALKPDGPHLFGGVASRYVVWLQKPSLVFTQKLP